MHGLWNEPHDKRVLETVGWFVWSTTGSWYVAIKYLPSFFLVSSFIGSDLISLLCFVVWTQCRNLNLQNSLYFPILYSCFLSIFFLNFRWSGIWECTIWSVALLDLMWKIWHSKSQAKKPIWILSKVHNAHEHWTRLTRKIRCM